MTPLPRGICSYCSHSVALRVNGVTREHQQDLGAGRKRKCPGSAKAPRELTPVEVAWRAGR